MMQQLRRLRFRRELLPRPAGRRSRAGEAAGLDLARPVDDADHLSDLHPARHRQGGARRHALRCLDHAVIIVGNAIPGFLFAILLIVLFAGGSYFQWFPLRGLVSDNWAISSWPARILDYFWHMALPLPAMVIGSFASLTMLTKNSFLDQINQQYVVTARAKGLTERRVLYGHVFRNAMLIVIAGFPAAFIGILFTGSLLIEIIFSLDGLGCSAIEAMINRDYPIVFATLYFFTPLGLVMNLVGDLTYTLVDPRIDFESRATYERAMSRVAPARRRASSACGSRRSPGGASRNFRANRRGFWSLWIFLALFVVSLFAEVIANDRPLARPLRGASLFPGPARLSGDDLRRRFRDRGRLPRSLRRRS